ncbi:MAG: hypothetical protein HC850_10925 [Rhodomicrobium sp.]|nr:hypothetical protein [Rhodomicrobium sp.]
MMRPSPLQPFVIAFHFLGIVVVTMHMGIGFRYFLVAIGLPRTGNVIAALIAGAGFVAATIAIIAYTGRTIS